VLHPSTQVENRAYLRVLIKQLRKKLGDSAENPKYILTDGYLGYRFRDR
jgi:two-component system KDP operon response regulator KdpE